MTILTDNAFTFLLGAAGSDVDGPLEGEYMLSSLHFEADSAFIILRRHISTLKEDIIVAEEREYMGTDRARQDGEHPAGAVSSAVGPVSLLIGVSW